MTKIDRRRRSGTALVLFVLLLPGLASAAGGAEGGLSYRSAEGAEERRIGSLGSSVHIRITGVVATTSVWQLFENPTDERIDAVYTFPIPERVAVDRLEMLIGDRTVRGVVREVEEAERVFTEAAAEGRAASLVRSERSNVFTTSVANIPPRATVEILVGWQQEVGYQDGVFSLRLPTALASRYGSAELESPPRLFPPGARQLGLRIDLDSGLPLAEVRSPTHEIAIEELSSSAYSVTLAEGVVPADRDFVVEWLPEPSSEPRVAVFWGGAAAAGERCVLLLAFPPPGAADPVAARTPREVIFVIDTSGSMQGAALAQAKAALEAALDRLEPVDRFNVIRFSSGARALYTTSADATIGAVERARELVRSLEAGGGTEMMAALDLALDDDGLDSRLRQVVFVTDGRVGGEGALFRYIAANLGRSRLFTVGIGPTPNGHFLRNAARHGRGSFTSVSGAAAVGSSLDGLLRRLETPALTDLGIFWPDAFAELAREPIPDLYAGEALSVAARLLPLEGAAEIRGWREDDAWDESVMLPASAGPAELRGRRGGRQWSRRLDAAGAGSDVAIAKLWAARRIEALTDRLVAADADQAEVREQVTEIALRYQVVSPYTSLVAVDEEALDVETSSSGEGGVTVLVRDTEGSPLPGAVVALSGPGGDRALVSAGDGRVRFRAPPGEWRLRVELDGFSTVEYPRVTIDGSRTTLVEVELSSGVREVLTVTSQSPLLDQRRVGSVATIGRIELEKIPAACDAWSALSRIPGAVVDGIHLGGGLREAALRAPGLSEEDDELLIDGVAVSPLPGTAPAGLYDGERLAGIDVTTVGPDVGRMSGGASVDLTTRRGTNDLLGSARLRATAPGALEGEPPAIGGGRLGADQERFLGDSVEGGEDWTVQAGGPARRDRLWLWGSYGRDDSRTLSGGISAADLGAEETLAADAALKVNAQLAADNSALAAWHGFELDGIGVDASPTRPRPTTWIERQTTSVLTIEDTHVFTPSFFVSGTWSLVDGEARRTSEAVEVLGAAAPRAHRDADGVWRGSFAGEEAIRRSEAWTADGRYFFGGGRPRFGNHELDFGVRRRRIETGGVRRWPGGGARSLAVGNGSRGAGGLEPALLIAQRGAGAAVTREHLAAWVQDTVSAGDWTINAGLRYDRQDGRNEPARAEAGAWFPSLQPAIDFGGAEAPFDWETLSPRLGLARALGAERRTLLRAGFSRFTERLRAVDVGRTNPAAPSYLTLLWRDADGSGDFNGSGLAGNGPDEVVLLGSRGLDLGLAGTPWSADRTDPGLEAELTDEAILGVEHAPVPELVVGVGLTWRRVSRIHEHRALVRDATGGVRVNTADDYILERELTGALPDGTPYGLPVWSLAPALSYTGGTLLTNGDRERTYRGVGARLVKRLSHRWMLRGWVEYGDAEWEVPESFRRHQSPNLCEDSLSLGCDGAAGGAVDGGLFAGQRGSRVPEDDLWSQSSWPFALHGLYELAPGRPWGFDLAGSLFGREGYPLPWFVDHLGADGQDRDLLAAGRVDAFRADDLVTLDLRLAKEIAAGGRTKVTAGVDLFNALDETSVLRRERGLSRGAADHVRETLAPRTWRLGVRLAWR